MSCVMCQVSRVTYLKKKNSPGQSGKAYRGMVCYQRGLPRLFYIYFLFVVSQDFWGKLTIHVAITNHIILLPEEGRHPLPSQMEIFCIGFNRLVRVMSIFLIYIFFSFCSKSRFLRQTNHTCCYYQQHYSSSVWRYYSYLRFQLEGRC